MKKILRCPHCGAGLSDGDVDEREGRVRCRRCGREEKLSYVRSVISPKDELPAELPRGVTAESVASDFGTEFRLRSQFSTLEKTFLAVFSLIWAGGLVAWLRASPSLWLPWRWENAPAVAVFVLFVLVGVYMICLNFMMLRGPFELRMAKGTGRLWSSGRLFPRWRTFRYGRETVVRLVEGPQRRVWRDPRRGGFRPRRSWRLRLETPGEAPVVFGAGMAPEVLEAVGRVVARTCAASRAVTSDK